MKYTLLGSLGHITKPLAQQLVAAGHDVTVISSQQERKHGISAIGAKPAIGSANDVAFLASTFKGADAVFTLVPPKFDAKDWKQYIADSGKDFASAIKTAGVKKVVNLSSIGAHMPDGCGPVSGLHFEEIALNSLAGVDIRHLRPAFFFTNFLSNVGMIKHAGIYGNNYGSATILTMIHPKDVAAAAAEELQGLKFKGHSIRYIVGDEKNSLEIAAILGKAIGKPDLPYVEFKDEDALKGALQAGLPEDVAKNFVEMGAAIRTGAMGEDYLKHKVALSPTKLENFAKEFAEAYAHA